MTNAKYSWLFCMALLMPVMLSAQLPVQWQVVVLDSVRRSPLQGVHVRIEGPASKGGATVLVSDAEGRFVAPGVQGGSVVLHLSHVGYVPLRYMLGPTVPALPVELLLVPRTFEIPEVVIRRRVPEVVYQRRHLHVGDHYACKEGVWVLAYEQPRLWHRQENAGEQLFRSARLVLLDTLFNELSSRALPGEVRRLYRDHRGRVVVDGRQEAWVAEYRDSVIALGVVDRKTLHRAILPWTDSTAGRLLGNNRSADWPAFEHLAYDPSTDTQEAFCAVQDEHVMDLFRSQYKYMSGRDKVIAMDLEKETGVDREVIAGFMTGFQHDIYFKVPYAPLFVVDDTLCVFDHSRERIRRYTVDGLALDEVPMQHIKGRGWRGRLVQDAAEGDVYALFASGAHSWLCRVDPATGVLGVPTSLTHPFPEEVQVFSGHAYYVYRPKGALDHRTLFREALR